MQHFHKIASGLNVAPVLAQLDAHPELWNQHNPRKAFLGSPHDQTSDLWVRFNDHAKLDPNNYAAFSDEHIPVWYPAWDKLTALRPIIFQLMAEVEGEMLGGVLLTCVPPGAQVRPHRDKSWHVSYYSKFYVGLQSAPGAIFGCEDEEINIKSGECFLMDNRKLHWVDNRSNIDRITAIICIRCSR